MASLRSPEEINHAGRVLVAFAYFGLFCLFGTNLISTLFYSHVVSDYAAYQKGTFVVQKTERAHDSEHHDSVTGLINGRYPADTLDGKTLFQVADFSQIKPGDTCDVYIGSTGTGFGYGTKNPSLIAVGDYVHARALLAKHLIIAVATAVGTFLIWKINPWFHPFRAASRPAARAGQ